MERLCYRGVKEAAAALGMSKNTFMRLYKNDPTFPVIHTGPRNSLCLFPVKEIRDWMAAQAANNKAVSVASE